MIAPGSAATRSIAPLAPRALVWTCVILAVAGAVVIVPLAPWLLLAVWFAALTRPLLLRMGRAFHGRHKAAAFLTVLLFVCMVVPVVIIAVSLGREARDLAAKLMHSDGGRTALQSIVSPEGPPGEPLKLGAKSVFELVQQHGASAWSMLGVAAGAATEVGVGLFLFFWGAYAALADGARGYAWLEAHAPIERRHVARFAEAFKETGRGLLVGVGLTGMAQAVVATVAYVALDVPRALVLGLVTFVCSLIPSIGCALVWVPVAAGLALTGQSGKALILVAIGVGVISTVDNVFRPIFSKYGNLRLPSFLIIVSMFGGLAMFGGWGLALGPLFVRMAREALEIAAEERLAASTVSSGTSEANA